METLRAGGWTVESSWLDLDGRGERTWNRTIDPHGAVRWLTVSELQEALHRDGLDVGDLTLVQAPRLTDRRDGCE